MMRVILTDAQMSSIEHALHQMTVFWEKTVAASPAMYEHDSVSKLANGALSSWQKTADEVAKAFERGEDIE